MISLLFIRLHHFIAEMSLKHSQLAAQSSALVTEDATA